ncbi:MAG: winged helix-turn-helix domain-containing protein, partial [Gammaproteobacteria bacterium]|nr:winged helix-turn-helix domain-containing protein [Gammaproteobacteria bacterium]
GLNAENLTIKLAIMHKTGLELEPVNRLSDVTNPHKTGKSHNNNGDAMDRRGKIYYFGDYRLCPQTRELLCGDKQIRVRDKIFNLLSHLIENSDRAISKQELIDVIWGGRPLSTTVISRSIMVARRAIGDDCESQHCIRTVHSFGYHFIAEVSNQLPAGDYAVPDAGDHAEADVEKIAFSPTVKPWLTRPLRSIWMRKGLTATIVLIVLVIGITGSLIYNNVVPTKGSVPTATMKFMLLSMQTEQQSLNTIGARVTMLFDRKLSRLPWLNIIPASSMDALDNNYPEYCILATQLSRIDGEYKIVFQLIESDTINLQGEISGSNPFLIADNIVKIVTELTQDIAKGNLGNI